MHSSNSACTQPRLKLTQVASEWLPPSLPEGSTCVHSCCIYVFVFLFRFAFMYFSSFLYLHSCICLQFACTCLCFGYIVKDICDCVFVHLSTATIISDQSVYTTLQIFICIILFAHDRSLSINKVY